jgi:nucleotide-binding universal stress UspA family protein
VAAFTSADPAGDVVHFASQQDVELLLVDGGTSAQSNDLRRGRLGGILAHALSDVGVLVTPRPAGEISRLGPVVVPFGAARHDWTALELGAWFARAQDASLVLVGALSRANARRRDASQLLADASILVQRCAGIVAEPMLASRGAEGLLAAAAGAGLLVVGLSERWAKEGLGRARRSIAERSPAPVLFVRRGVRPGGLAPSETRTRFTWSLASAAD